MCFSVCLSGSLSTTIIQKARAKYGTHRRREQHTHTAFRQDCDPDYLRAVNQTIGGSYFFFGGTRCVKTEADTVLTPFGVDGLLSNLLAIDATRADVFSLDDFLVAI